MEVSILEALQNANINIKSGSPIGIMIAQSQLNNAVVLLEKGYSIHEEVEPLLEKYGDIENVPYKNNDK